MKVLIKQRFQYATISLLKNYCVVPKKPLSVVSEPNLGNLEQIELLLFSGKQFRLAEKKNKKKVYFHTNNPGGENLDFDVCKLHGASKFITTSEDKIKKYYGNPFAKIEITTYERKIQINGDNITIKFYSHVKSREYNWKFFSKSSLSKTVSFNLKNGNITTVESNHGKNGTTRVRRNSFQEIYKILSYICIGPATVRDYNTYPKNKLANEKMWAFQNLLKKELDNDIFYETLYVLFAKEDKIIPHSTRDFLIFSTFLSEFIRIKKIKVPNKYFNLIVNWYPTQKFLKKNDHKLVASILDRFGLKTKYLIKLLHQEPNLNLLFLIRLCWFFGDDYLKYIPKINHKILLDFDVLKDTNSFFVDNQQIKQLEFNANEIKQCQINSDIEKHRALKFFNQAENSFVNKINLINDFTDHLNMLKVVRKYYPEKTMKANSIESFKEEHLELSKLTVLIKKGETIEYTYNEDMLAIVEKEITTVSTNNEHKFYPVVLKREEEYIEEGTHMHHCVASYVDRESSFIISLRLNSSFGSERVTCEYDVKTAGLVQSRYFCNAEPPEIFDEALKELHDRIAKCRFKLKWIDKKIKSLIINGIEVKNEAYDKIFVLDHGEGWLPLPF